MKFKVSLSEFVEKLSLASRFTSSQFTNINSLQGIKIVCYKNEIEISSSNLNDFFSTKIPAKTEKEGKVIFDGKKALDFLRFIEEKTATIELKENNIVIDTEKARGTFQIYPVDDYPDIIKAEGKKGKFSKNFIQKLPFVLFASSKDETRPELTGVYFTKNEGILNVVATDGFRLSLIEDKEEGKDIGPFILSSRFLYELISQKKDKESFEYIYSENDKIVSFLENDSVYTTRVIQGEFPPYEKVIPDSYNVLCVVNTQEFRNGIKLISVFAKELSNVVVLNITKKGLVLTPKSTKEIDSKVVIDTESLKGEEIKTAFNYKFLLDFLSFCDSEKTQIELTGPTSPGVFKPYDKNEFLHIIMPLRMDEL